MTRGAREKSEQNLIGRILERCHLCLPIIYINVVRKDLVGIGTTGIYIAITAAAAAAISIIIASGRRVVVVLGEDFNLEANIARDELLGRAVLAAEQTGAVDVVNEVLGGEEGMDQVGLDTVQRSVVDHVRELFLLVLVRLGRVDVLLLEVPALEPGLGALVHVHVRRVWYLVI